MPERIYGPVQSRRLGASLGINILPEIGKICSFDCIYCERGWNKDHRTNETFPSREEVSLALEKRLEALLRENAQLDYLTFSGNGEPTLHPAFYEIINDTVLLRDTYVPQTKIAVLTNGTNVENESVFQALMKVDNAILKFDSAIEKTARLIDKPAGNFSPEKQIAAYQRFRGHCTVQTLFLTGEIAGETIDNTTEKEVAAYIGALEKIMPKTAMLYTIDRATPCETLHKANRTVLESIAKRVNALGIETIIAE